MNELMNFNYLLKTESKTREDSYSKHKVWYSNYSEIINCLFQISYYVGEEKDVESDNGYFFGFCSFTYS